MDFNIQVLPLKSYLSANINLFNTFNINIYLIRNLIGQLIFNVYKYTFGMNYGLVFLPYLF